MNIPYYIDYTLLNPLTTERDVIEHCEKAKSNGYYSVSINSCYVALAKQILDDVDVKICSTIGFPFGAMSTVSKVFEAQKAIEDGADEIEMVINLGFLKSRNFVSVLKDISDVKFAIDNTPLNVIIEISELNKNEIIKATEICLDANIDFISTSSGFSKGGATLTAVKIIKKTVKNKLKIKANGGIDDYETVIKYLEAGADKVGTSANIQAKSKAQQIRNTKVYKKYLENLELKDISNNSNSPIGNDIQEIELKKSRFE